MGYYEFRPSSSNMNREFRLQPKASRKPADSHRVTDKDNKCFSAIPRTDRKAAMNGMFSVYFPGRYEVIRAQTEMFIDPQGELWYVCTNSRCRKQKYSHLDDVPAIGFIDFPIITKNRNAKTFY